MTNYKGNDKNAQKGNKTSNTNTSKGGNNIMMNDKNVMKVNSDGTVTLTVDALRELLLGAPKQAQTAPKAAPKAPAVSKVKAAKPATKAEPKKTGADALKAYRESVKGKPYTEVKFGTQEYLRVPRKDGTHKEVAHINFCTKKNRCVGSLDLAKYEKSDFTYVKEFFVANCDKFTYDTDKLNKVGVTSPTDVRRMSEYTMKAAFGC